jgi:tetratricopeptide (TPR) repeat protein
MMARRVLAFSLVLLLVGCFQASPEAKKAKHRERGQGYFEKAKYAEALIEYKNVVQIDPKDSDAHYRLALTYIKIGGMTNLQQAFAELSKTVELNPKNVDAQLKLGEMYLLAKEPNKARERADIVLASTPNHSEGLVLRGQSLISEQEFAQGIAELKKALELTPKNTRIYLDLAHTYIQMKKPEQAEQTLKEALGLSPNAPELIVAMGDLRVLTGRAEEAEGHYLKAIEVAPEQDGLYVKLASYFQLSRKWEQAESAYRRLAERKPTDEKPQLVLGDYYVSIGQPDKALGSYKKAVELAPSSTAARDKLIDHHLNMGSIEEAEKLTAAILEKAKKDVSGRYFQGRILLTRSKTDEALSMLQGVVKDEPRSAQAHHHLGVAYAQQGDWSQAKREFAEAIKLAPTMIEPRNATAALHLALGDVDLAIEEAEHSLRTNSRNLKAALILGDAYLRKGDLKRAKVPFEAILRAIPQEPYSHTRLGIIARNEKHPEEAVQHFEAALAIAPEMVEPLSQLASMKLAQGKTAEARARVKQQSDAYPSNALLHNLLGTLFMLGNDSPQAETEFKKAIELKDDLTESYMNLASLYYRTQRMDQAVKEYETLIAKNPKIASAHVLVGMIQEQRREFDKAKTHYQAALKINGKFAPAANNLAWILTETGGNIDEALTYAQTAREQRPDDPHIGDTLGWIYYKKNAFLKAASVLKDAADKLPENPVIKYHYGMALMKNGDKPAAKKALESSLKLSASYPGSDEAKAALKQL